MKVNFIPDKLNDRYLLMLIHFEILEIHRCEEDSVLVSFISTSDATSNTVNEFDQSFMYTQILKEILLEMKSDEQSIRDFIIYWRSQYVDCDSELKTIVQFEREYSPELSICWYTHSTFLYS